MWRSKQLEYAFLLFMMGRYERFWTVTERALRYVNRGLGEAEVGGGGSTRGLGSSLTLMRRGLCPSSRLAIQWWL
jgi:hypothetical protein